MELVHAVKGCLPHMHALLILLQDMAVHNVAITVV
jgi:hypothetical protein